MGRVRIRCPYCNKKFTSRGCFSKHVMHGHPDKKKEYIRDYVDKRGW